MKHEKVTASSYSKYEVIQYVRLVCEVCGVEVERSLQGGNNFGLYCWSGQSEIEDSKVQSSQLMQLTILVVGVLMEVVSRRGKNLNCLRGPIEKKKCHKK